MIHTFVIWVFQFCAFGKSDDQILLTPKSWSLQINSSSVVNHGIILLYNKIDGM